MLHCDGNDTGECKSILLINDIIAPLKFIFEILPYTKIIWSQILPRLKWRHKTSHAAVDKIRKRINSKIATFVLRSGGCYIRYPKSLSRTMQQTLQRFMFSNIKASPSLN
ncbi:hypothetical protein KUTeg_007310 [Tegillarca granosa]|uniref:Uncharacterized protein n=1 Tax=Tegillarca granosa TaxID=220873 RepID=A0ABQ9FFW6_TEGGR|nr:hypothetical protein KUTeg_007310 [Tegillarca granosa]